ncbi:hypothetical protein K461DRAFT_317493 [Myriangium duriaei CBS 260.36]|uniref:Structure-specific endonuclease subunit SLX4 n=1 Tax=Myriangium duriaei CBS 260.36 TaxID=1168546 RepID=A0A9P4MSC4_9PEZI|nr:hypothetical protein K461DRAFT_317493 [Myriangium duriaei CBS 260.36]
MAATIHNPIVLSSSSPIQALDHGRSTSPDTLPSLPSLSRHSSIHTNAFTGSIRGESLMAQQPTHKDPVWPNQDMQESAPDSTRKQAETSCDDSGTAQENRILNDKSHKTAEPVRRLSPHFEGTRPVHAPAIPSDTKAVGKRKRATNLAVTSDIPPKTRKRTAKAKTTTSVDVTSAVDAEGAAETSTVPTKPPPKKPARKKPAKKVETSAASNANEVSHHFNQKPSAPDLADASPAVVESSHFGDGSLGLDMAPLRRRSWTPIPGDELPPSNQHVDDEAQPQQNNGTAFQNIVNSFGFQTERSDSKGVNPKPPRTTTRKKKVEIVDGVAPKRKTAAERKAAAAKKTKEPKPPKPPKVVRAKTITDFAISAYRKAANQTEIPSDVPVTAFFQPASTQMFQLENDPTSVLEPEGPTTSKRKKVNSVLQFQFPPPEKAQSKMHDQDFLFGTSSQLAKDESPRTHRMIQQAIEESEDMTFFSPPRSDDCERSPTTSRTRVANAPHGTSLSVGPGESNLWTVAARDADLKMFICSQRRPNDGRSLERPASPSVADVLPGVLHEEQDESLPDAALMKKTPSPDLPEMNRSDEEHTDKHDSGFVDISEVEQTYQNKAALQSPAVAEKIEDKHAQPFVDKANSHRPALQTLDINTPISNSPTKLKFTSTVPRASPAKRSPAKNKILDPPPSEPVKRPRGRPRKDVAVPAPKTATPKATAKNSTTAPKRKPTTKPPGHASAPSTPKCRGRSPRPSKSRSSWADIDEISDSEGHASPPSPAKSPSGSKPQPLALSPTTTPPPTGVSSNATPPLFAAITAAVRAQPRTKDPTKPSWREKMLLYDPIVLEDFTAWLVEQGIRGNGMGQLEVGAGDGELQEEMEVDVEEEEKKKSKGKAKGKGKAKAKAKEKEKAKEQDPGALQPWAVQRWCEANSICCLWKAGLRGGVRARY